jgi:hypothetical protein
LYLITGYRPIIEKMIILLKNLLYIFWSIFVSLYGTAFGPKRDEVTREWRKLHNEELHDL